MFRKLRRVLSIALLLISIAMITWAALPNKHQHVVQSISPVDMQLPQTDQGNNTLSIPARQVKLEWPQSMRIGEDEAITLEFVQVITDSVPSSQPVRFADIYKDYNLMAEARYDVAGMNVSPASSTRKSMPAGQTVKFTWKVNANKAGSYNGTVWLSLRFLPLAGGDGSQAPIYIREINIRTNSLLGLNVSLALLLGGLGVLLAIVIDYDDVLGWLRIKK